jgi:hypothetical protein
MHYTLDQCKEIARILLNPTDRVPLKVVLDHTLPWPTDTEVHASLLEADKSKKQAAVRLGITKRCLRRRLKEIKENGISTRPLEPLTVHEVLDRLLHNQSFQQISEETEVHQSLLCRLLTGLIVAIKQPALVQRAPRRRGRTEIRHDNEITITTDAPSGEVTWVPMPVANSPYQITTGRVSYANPAWDAASTQAIMQIVMHSTNVTTNVTNSAWTTVIDTSDFTGGTPRVESEHGTTPQLTDETPHEGETTGGA